MLSFDIWRASCLLIVSSFWDGCGEKWPTTVPPRTEHTIVVNVSKLEMYTRFLHTYMCMHMHMQHAHAHAHVHMHMY